MNCDMTRRTVISALAAATLPLPACQPSEGRLDADIVVIGAGLSGLYSAMLLEDAGYEVQVIEALNRVGGRMYTLDHGDGFTEGGGQQIGANYARMLDVAAQLNVPLYESSDTRAPTAFYLNGQWQTPPLDLTEFPAAFASTPPPSVLFRLLSRSPGFEAADSWLDAPDEMDISASAFLDQHGFSPDAKALIARTLNANNLETYSMLNLHRTWQLYQQSNGMGRTQYVEGGSQKLPEAMAASLSRPVILNMPVSEIEVEPNVCRVTAGGRRWTARRVVCTLPIPALKRIKGLSGWNEAQREALQNLAYTQILQMHMRCRSPFWETDQLPKDMWADTPLERVFADQMQGGELSGFHRGWVNGDGTAHWLERPDPLKAYKEALGQLRPATQDALEPLSLIDWTYRNVYAGGAYYYWQPGQAKKMAKTLGDPIGPLHFAGEHLGILHTGMEAAMEAAERVALAIMETRV